jgi:hypothetical protein
MVELQNTHIIFLVSKFYERVKHNNKNCARKDKMKKKIYISIICGLVALTFIFFNLKGTSDDGDLVNNIFNAISSSKNINYKFDIEVEANINFNSISDTVKFYDKSKYLVDENGYIQENNDVYYKNILNEYANESTNYYDSMNYKGYLKSNNYKEATSYTYNKIRSYLVDDLYYYFCDKDVTVEEKTGKYIYTCDMSNESAKEILENLNAQDICNFNTYFNDSTEKIKVTTYVNKKTYEIEKMEFEIQNTIKKSLESDEFYNSKDINITKCICEITFEYNTSSEIKLP